MKTLIGCALVVFAFTAYALAPRARVWSQTSATNGSVPTLKTEGVSLNEAEVLRVAVVGVAGTVTGGKLCAYYLPPDAGVGEWRHNPLLDFTLSGSTGPTGAADRVQQLPDLAIGGRYGRTAFVACGLTGTANDAGTANFTVVTESWGRNLPL